MKLFETGTKETGNTVEAEIGLKFCTIRKNGNKESLVESVKNDIVNSTITFLNAKENDGLIEITDIDYSGKSLDVYTSAGMKTMFKLYDELNKFLNNAYSEQMECVRIEISTDV